MKNKTILFLALVAASGVAMAQQSVLDAASQTLDTSKKLNETVKNAPVTAKEQAQEAAKQKLEQATPEQVKQGAAAVNSGKETASKLKGKVDALPKSPSEASDVVEGKAKQKAAEKAFDLLH